MYQAPRQTKTENFMAINFALQEIENGMHLAEMSGHYKETQICIF
jgi:hypothetical protein